MITNSQKIDLLKKMMGQCDVDKRGINAQFWCPFCKDANRKKRKLAIRIEDGIAHCWVCGWKARNIAILAPLFEARELLPELLKAFGTPTIQIEEPTVSTLSLPKDFKMIGFLSNNEYDNYSSSIEYLSNRGITLDVVKSFRLGTSDEWIYKNRIMFPSFDNEGKLNFLTARTIFDIKPKYLNADLDRQTLIFNEIDIDWKRELIIVEGPFDLLSCYGLNATAMLGSWLDERYKLFENIVINQTPIVLALDPDAINKQIKIAQNFIRYGISVRCVLWNDNNTDPGSIGVTAFREIVKQARLMNFEGMLKYKLANVLDSVKLT